MTLGDLKMRGTFGVFLLAMNVMTSMHEAHVFRDN